jgi:hypothetical protein
MLMMTAKMVADAQETPLVCKTCGGDASVISNIIQVHYVPGTNHFRCFASGCPFDLRQHVIDRHNGRTGT